MPLCLYSNLEFKNMTIRCPVTKKATRGLSKAINRHCVLNRKFRAPRSVDKGPRKLRAAISYGKKVDKQMAQLLLPVVKKRMFLPETLAFDKLFASREWCPIGVQVPVVWPEARISTCLDMVLRDIDGNYIVLELKTGYRYRHMTDHGCRLVGKASAGVRARDLHALQTALGAKMFKNTYDVGDAHINPYLVYAIDNNVEIYCCQLAESWPDGLEAVCQKLTSTKNVVQGMRAKRNKMQ